jgi:DNA-directed RNA polymerase sigma subunit (sigma70/sigma32)
MADDDSELKRTLKGLTEREREVLKRRFGIDASKDLSLEEFKITRERIRAIEERAISRGGLVIGSLEK